MQFHLIQPMGGGGTRFLGTQVLPKPLINLQNKPFFYWSTKSLYNKKYVKDVTFVVLQEHVDKFNIDKEILKYFPEANIVVLPQMLNGAVLTGMEGLKFIDDDLPIIFNDCDHAFKCSEFYDFFDNYDDEIWGGLMTFKSDEPKFSYIKYDENGNIVGTVEKVVVSNDAICGAYYFKNKKVFLDCANKYLHNCDYKEFFISGVYNEICKAGHKIMKFTTDLHLPFGTPDEYLQVKDSKEFKEIDSDADNR